MRLILTAVIALLLLVAVHVRADNPRPITKQEYRVVSVAASPQELEGALNELGKQGWIFVAEVRTALGESLVLRRETSSTEKHSTLSRRSFGAYIEESNMAVSTLARRAATSPH